MVFLKDFLVVVVIAYLLLLYATLLEQMKGEAAFMDFKMIA
jgi:hypothetical protein